MLCGALTLAAPGMHAQSVPSTVAPGSIERQLNQQPPPPPANNLSIPPPSGFEAPPNAAGIALHLTAIEITGATAISAEELEKAYHNFIGRDGTVADLYAAANAITAKYTEKGFALSFAVVPKQVIENGRAQILVIEGYVAEYRFEGDDTPPVLTGYAAHILVSKPLRTATLERFLLLANDIPGYTVRSVFDRIENAPRGATRLVIHVEHKAFSGGWTEDNRGSRALGPWRLDLNARADGLLGFGESIGLRSFLSTDLNELRYGSVDTSWPLGNNGTRLVAAGSYSDSHPSVPLLSAAGFGSNGITARLGAEHPLIRSRIETLQLDAYVSGQWLKSSLASLPNSRDHVYTLSVGGTYWVYNASGLWSAAAHAVQGLPVFGATTPSVPLRSRASGSGVFTALNVTAMRLQRLSDEFDALASISGQLSSRGLLSSQQCGYGGMQFGRGFDDSEIVGDDCATASLELRYNAGFAGELGLQGLQFYGFGDGGYAMRRGQLLPQERRSDSAASAGAGVRWRINDNLSGWAEYAQPLGRDVALENNRHGRVFVAISAGF